MLDAVVGSRRDVWGNEFGGILIDLVKDGIVGGRDRTAKHRVVDRALMHIDQGVRVLQQLSR